MAHVRIESGKVVAVFGVAQKPSDMPGYAEIADNDPRLATFHAEQIVPRRDPMKRMLKAMVGAGKLTRAEAVSIAAAIDADDGAGSL